MDGNELFNPENQPKKDFLERCKVLLREKVFSKKGLRTAATVLLVLLVPWLIMLALQYRQLRQAFINRNEFVPTRIYSDVARIAPPQKRGYILGRLKSLGYEWAASGDTVSFKLREIDYPGDLLPDDHRTFDIAKSLVRLQFDGTGADALLSSIETGGEEISDFYLEPELITTLTRKTTSAADQIRNYVPFERIPSAIWKAIMAVEDQHFLDHKGLDPRGFARAILIDIKTLSLAQGGSTLTQQLVKNLMVRRTKNLIKKFNEIFLALLLEAEFEKEKILERYLNEVYLGQIGNFEIHGVSEGAEYFFGKQLDQLNLAEIALMAGIIRGPWYYSPYRDWDRAIERQRLVLEKMVETGQIAAEEALRAQKMPIRLVPPPKALNKAPYFADYVKAKLIDMLDGRLTEPEIIHAGFRVYTTLDPEMNVAAQASVAAGVGQLRSALKLSENLRLEGALASVDHSTGYVRALVGGTNYTETSFNRILNMKRQVGSTFKPLVYLSAILKGQDAAGIPYGPGYPVNDDPWKLVFDGGRQTWEPRNYEKEFRGWITLREALAHSVNVAAAKVGNAVGLDRIAQTAKALGVQSEVPLFPAATLGVSELSPMELLQVYSTLANRGVQEELTVIRDITQNDGSPYAHYIARPTRVVDEGPVDLLTDMLREVFRSGTARFARDMGFDRPAAGKTGTTSDYRDAWFAGYTPQLTTVVWVGLDKDLRQLEDSAEEKEAEAKVKLTGASSALPIWVRYMNKALSDLPPSPFPISDHLSEVLIDRHTGRRASGGCPDDQTVLEKYLASDSLGAEETCEHDWPVSIPVTVTDDSAGSSAANEAEAGAARSGEAPGPASDSAPSGE